MNMNWGCVYAEMKLRIAATADLSASLYYYPGNTSKYCERYTFVTGSKNQRIFLRIPLHYEQGTGSEGSRVSVQENDGDAAFFTRTRTFASLPPVWRAGQEGKSSETTRTIPYWQQESRKTRRSK